MYLGKLAGHNGNRIEFRNLRLLFSEHIDRTYRLFISRLSQSQIHSYQSLLCPPQSPIAGAVIPQWVLAKTLQSSFLQIPIQGKQKREWRRRFSPRPRFSANAQTPKIKPLKTQTAEVYVLSGESIRRWILMKSWKLEMAIHEREKVWWCRGCWSVELAEFSEISRHNLTEDKAVCCKEMVGANDLTRA